MLEGMAMIRISEFKNESSALYSSILTRCVSIASASNFEILYADVGGKKDKASAYRFYIPFTQQCMM